MKVVEIFQSIDGEVNHFSQGRISTFIRFAGCNLNCSYCDTLKAKNIEEGNYTEMTVEQILTEIKNLGKTKITLTGGEPLLQEEIFKLIDKLTNNISYNDNYDLSIETNGSIQIPPNQLIKKEISWIIDYKLEYEFEMIEKNWRYLTSKDWIKFPVRGIDEIQQAIKIKDEIKEFYREITVQFAISPINNNKIEKGEIEKLINYLISIKEFDFIVNLQLHKFINVR